MNSNLRKKPSFGRKPKFGKPKTDLPKTLSKEEEPPAVKRRRFGNKTNAPTKRPKFGKACMPTIKPVQRAPVKKNKYRRALVLEVTENCDEGYKEIRAFDQVMSQQVEIRLLYIWRQTTVNPGDTIHIIGKPISKEQNNHYIINNTENLIIVHPDTLVVPTMIAQSFPCMREAVLNKKLRSNELKEVMLNGTMSHELFEKSLQRNCFDREKIRGDIEEIIKCHTLELFAIDVDEARARKNMEGFIPNMINWGKLFLNDRLQSKKNVVEWGGDDKRYVNVDEVTDIEDSVFCPMYGVRGNIDGSFKISHRPTLRSEDSENRKRKRAGGGFGFNEPEEPCDVSLVPFELKTGKFNGYSIQKAMPQVVLYSLMMQDRFGEIGDGGQVDPTIGGLLYFLRENKLRGIPVRHQEVVGLIIRRNAIAGFIHDDGKGLAPKLPPMFKDQQKCSRCFKKEQCLIYHRALEDGDKKSSGIPKLYNEFAGHLDASHCDYLALWTRLIDSEERSEKSRTFEIWTMSSDEREENGDAFGHLVASKGDHTYEDGRHVYVLRRDPKLNKPFDITSSRIFKDSYVSMSTEDGKYCFAKGCIIDISESSITWSSRNRLKWFGNPETQFRIDVDTSSFGSGLLRANVLRMFLVNNADTKRRRLIVDLQAPSFNTHFNLQKTLPKAIYEEFQTLNADQQRAVAQALSANDYSLILGMPGTGKSTTIVFLVRVLSELRKTVLLSAYTNSAVDNLALKLKKYKRVEFCRIGRKASVHHELHEYIVTNSDFSTVREVRNYLQKKTVVCATALTAAGTPLVTTRNFDYCIIDEASQVTQPVCIGPLLYCKTFILVGDHYQLPPLVTSTEAKEGGLDISLFKRLAEAHPQAVTSLRSQYRMNHDIMDLSNLLVYNNTLKCGNGAVSERCLDIPNRDRINPKPVEGTWLHRLLLPESRVLFLDTDKMNIKEETAPGGKGTINPTEVKIMCTAIEALLQGGIQVPEIGIISPYRSQLKIIREVLPNPDFLIDTIDRYQGRDKDCIFLSFVHSNEKSHVSHIMLDWRRINVAVSRAKRKLVFVGSSSTLAGGSSVLRDLIAFLKKRNLLHTIKQR